MAMSGASLPTIGHAPGSSATAIYGRLHPQKVAEERLAGEATMRRMMKQAGRREKLADRRQPKLLKSP